MSYLFFFTDGKQCHHHLLFLAPVKAGQSHWTISSPLMTVKRSQSFRTMATDQAQEIAEFEINCSDCAVSTLSEKSSQYLHSRLLFHAPVTCLRKIRLRPCSSSDVFPPLYLSISLPSPPPFVALWNCCGTRLDTRVHNSNQTLVLFSAFD